MSVNHRKYQAKEPRKVKRERTGLEKLIRFLIVLVLLALMGLAGYSQYVNQTFFPEKALNTILSPVQGTFSRVITEIDDYFARMKLRGNIEYEYNQLRAANEQLVYDALRVKELEDEVIRLENLMGVYSDYATMDPILARVTARESGNWFSTFTIDKGSSDGVENNMAVITTEGLVGRVYETFSNQAKVITIIDSDSNIAGLIQSSRDQGMVRGTLGVDGQPLCRMYYLPDDTVPRPGDEVVTSGIGIAFPSGLPIGTIRESTRAMEEGKYYIVVEPTANFKNIEEVLVLRYEAELVEMPEGMNEDDELELMSLPPAPEQAVIEESALEATIAPLPNAPGRATPTPMPEEGAEGTPLPPEATGGGSGLLGTYGTILNDPTMDGDEELSEEGAAMREAFLNE